jgi:thiol-disulfide isomerase/thioredoxin
MRAPRKTLAVLLLLLAAQPGCDSRPGNPPRILAFTASWCQVCHRQRPQLDALSRAGFDITLIDVDLHPEAADRYQVHSLPTYLVIVNGETYRCRSISALQAQLKNLPP